MMMRMLILQWLGMSVAIAGLAMSCIPTQAGKNQSGSSLFASTDGFEEDDLKRLKPDNFLLTCAIQGNKPVLVKANKIDSKAVEFPGDDLKDGMSCFLEVRGPVDPLMEYTWLGQNKDGKPAAGLYYMSEEAKIVAGKLTLPIVKLYTVKPSDSFFALLTVQFNGQDVIPDANNNEQYMVKVSAELVCKDGKHRSLPAEKIGDQERLRTFRFADLSVTKMKSETCQEIRVYEGNNTLIYKSETLNPPMNFVTAAVGQTLNLQVAVNKFIPPQPAKPYASASVKCVAKNANNQCTKFDLPRNQNLWAAEVVILDRQQNTNEVYIITGPEGIVDNKTKTVDVALLNAENGALGFSSVKIYSQQAKDLVLKREVNATPQSLATFEANFLGRDIQFEFFLNVYLHGFHLVDQNAQRLAVRSEQRENWVALADVLANGEIQAQYLIGGAGQYFASDRDAQNKLFTWESFVAEKKANGLERYQAYVFQDALMGATGLSCGTTRELYIEAPSEQHPQALRSGQEVSDYQYCQVQTFPEAYLDGHDVRFNMYVYGWQKF